MRIENARIEGNELILTVPDRQETRQFVYRFKAGEYDISRAKKKRSLDANRLMWEICTRISEAVNVPKEEIYRKNVKEVGVFTPLTMPHDALPDFERTWESNGMAWFVEVVDYGSTTGTVLVNAYKGSSAYDTKQMARLIDGLMQDAKNVGLDVLTERERSLFDGLGCTGSMERCRGNGRILSSEQYR